MDKLIINTDPFEEYGSVDLSKLNDVLAKNGLSHDDALNILASSGNQIQGLEYATQEQVDYLINVLL